MYFCKMHIFLLDLKGKRLYHFVIISLQAPRKELINFYRDLAGLE